MHAIITKYCNSVILNFVFTGTDIFSMQIYSCCAHDITIWGPQAHKPLLRKLNKNLLGCLPLLYSEADRALLLATVKIPAKTLMTIIILPVISWLPRNLRIQASIHYGQPASKHLPLKKASWGFPSLSSGSYPSFLDPFIFFVSNSLENVHEQSQDIFMFSSGTPLIYFYLNCKDHYKVIYDTLPS